MGFYTTNMRRIAKEAPKLKTVGFKLIPALSAGMMVDEDSILIGGFWDGVGCLVVKTIVCTVSIEAIPAFVTTTSGDEDIGTP